MEAVDQEAAALLQSSAVSPVPDGVILARQRAIHDAVLAQSRYLRTPNFTTIHPGDLESLFALYDQHYFAGHCRQALRGRTLSLRLSTRMSRAGGTTSRFRTHSGEIRFEIAIACGLLFDGFRAGDRPITVGGLPCATRLEALQRIFEHELVHLIEQLCWDTSDCAGDRFQQIAAAQFLHRAHTHELITRRERAAQAGIRPGLQVSFECEGRCYTGIVNRITKRATVLVEDASGEPFSNGRRYRTFYVPLALLRPAGSES